MGSNRHSFKSLLRVLKRLLIGLGALHVALLLAGGGFDLPVQAAPARRAAWSPADALSELVPLKAYEWAERGPKVLDGLAKRAVVAPPPALPTATPEPPLSPTSEPDLATPELLPPTPTVEPSPPPATPDEPAPLPEPASPSEVQEERWIDVDLSDQVLTAYENGAAVRTTLVSTGLPATPTPVGQFRIWVKFEYDDMEGPGYYLADVPYVMYFHQGYGLHGVFWHGNFGQPMSHGCINLPTAEAEWLFNWAEVGTLVNIHP